MGQESMSECELLRAEIESLKIDLQAMLGLRRTGSTSTIEKRLERLEAIVDARGLDWDHPRVEEPAKGPSLDGLPDIRTFAQPNLRWRRLEAEEVIQLGDWCNSLRNRQDIDPPDGGWIRAMHLGKKVSETVGLVFARPVADEPAKEPEPKHPAGPKPDPGEGYRLLSKDSEEELQLGDEVWNTHGDYWLKPCHWEPFGRQDANLWYRRKIEQPEPAWEPKVGDWVKVTRPVDWKEWEHPRWEGSMHEFDGRVGQIERGQGSDSGIGAVFNIRIRGFVGSDGTQHYWHRHWLSPAEPPAKEPEPAWEPKVGDWVKVTKPKKQDRGDDPIWLTTMDQYDGKVFQVKELIRLYQWPSVMCDGINCAFKIDWLSPAEPPKPPQPEYREPVLPADAGKRCEFSISGKTWDTLELVGWNDNPEGWPWKSRLSNNEITCWKQCRIKKDA